VAAAGGHTSRHPRPGWPQHGSAIIGSWNRPSTAAAGAAAVHWAEHLHVAHGVEAESLRGALCDDLDGLRQTLIRALDLHEGDTRRTKALSVAVSGTCTRAAASQSPSFD
jgi:hypothetical protein